MTDHRALALVREYTDLVGVLRDRADELNVSRECIDAIAGIQPGYSSKLLATVPMKHFGEASLAPVLAALGVAIVIVEDPETMQRFAPMRERRRTEFVRNGSRRRRNQTEATHG